MLLRELKEKIMNDFNFDDILKQFAKPQPKRKSTGIVALDDAIEKCVQINEQIQKI